VEVLPSGAVITTARARPWPNSTATWPPSASTAAGWSSLVAAPTFHWSPSGCAKTMRPAPAGRRARVLRS